MECGMKFIKYLLFGFNLIFFVIALVLIGVGAAVEIKYRELTMITGSTISSAPILLVCVGVFILIITFFGCCGAYKENNCMVTTFMVSLVIIFILEFSAGIAAFALKSRIDGLLKVTVQSAVFNYKPGNKKVFEVVQTKFKCCGGVSANDWRNATAFQAEANATGKATADLLVPDSCCVHPTLYCGIEAGHDIYNTTENGCVEKLEAVIKRNAGVIGGVGVGIAFFQIIGIIFACCLMKAIRKQYEVV